MTAAARLARALGEVVKVRREERGMSPDDLAARLGCTQPTVSRIESGAVMVNLPRLLGLASALDAAPSLLLSDAQQRFIGETHDYSRGVYPHGCKLCGKEYLYGQWALHAGILCPYCESEGTKGSSAED